MVNSREVLGLTGKLVAGAALACLMMSCGAKEEAKKIASGAGGGANLSATYASKCAGCHGASGEGGSFKALKTSSLSAAAWETKVRNGGSGTSMPSFAASVYSDADLQADYKAITGN